MILLPKLMPLSKLSRGFHSHRAENESGLYGWKHYRVLALNFPACVLSITSAKYLYHNKHSKTNVQILSGI